VYNPNLKQRHLRKTHSYFWIFEKSTTPQITLPSATFPTEKAINMRYQETSDEVSQIADATSDNANIKRNFSFGSLVGSNSK